MSAKARKEIHFSEYIPVTYLDERQVQLPTIPKGPLARTLAKEFKKYVKANFGRSPLFEGVIQYDEGIDTLQGSHFFALNVFGQMVRSLNSGFDVTSHRHLTQPEIADLAKDYAVYIDAQDALVLRGNAGLHDPRDQSIFDQLEEKVDNLDSPVLLTGLKVRKATPKETKRYGTGHGVMVVPTKDFRITHDSKKFGRQGGWYESHYAVSGLYRNSDGGLNANWDLADSDWDGRVALVSGEATRAKKQAR